MSSFIQELYEKVAGVLRINRTGEFLKLDNLVAGEYAFCPGDATLNNLVNYNINGPEIIQQLMSAKTHLERVIQMNKGFRDDKLKKLLNKLENVFQKNEEVAQNLKERGNMNEGYKMALRCYNLAALFAPLGSEVLGEIYGIRAILFNSQNEVVHCLEDIELALIYTCPEYLKSQLLALKEYLNGKLENTKQDKNISSEIQKYRDEIIFRVHGEHNGQIPSGHEGLRIKSNDRNGRYLITDCELKTGTTVIVEDPYALVLNNSTKWDTEHCGKCLRRIKRTVPCKSCVFVSYCSEECRLLDLKNGHRYECRCYPILHAIRMNFTLHLGLKSICKEGPENLFKRWKESSAEQNELRMSNDLSGIDPKTGIYNSASYYPLLYLKCHLENDKLSRIAWVAVTVIKTLDFKTNFFKNSPKFDNQNFKYYVASLFLLHGVSFAFNAASLSEHVEVEGHKGEEPTSEIVEIGSGIYSLISLMCHSCDPSVLRQDLPNGRIAIITNRHLYPGDELQLSYGYEFICDELEIRRRNILNRYCFNCNCIACSLKWKTYSETTYDRKYLCLNCSDHYKDCPAIQAKQCVLVHLTEFENTIGYCHNCKERSDLTEIMKEADRIEELLHDANKLVTENKLIEAIPMLIECIEFFQTHILPPFQEMISAQITLFDAYYCITKS